MVRVTSGLIAVLGALIPLTTLPSDNLGDIVRDVRNSVSLDAQKELIDRTNSFDKKDFEKFFNEAPKEAINSMPELAALAQKFADEAKQPQMFILVSSSMSENLIKTYAIDSITYNIPLVFRGVKPGQKVTDFLLKKVEKYKTDRGTPSIMIDPRPFSLWDVHAVPAIVYTTESISCNDFIDNGVHKDCKKADPKTYWKIQGSVTIPYAIEKFIDAGAPLQLGL